MSLTVLYTFYDNDKNRIGQTYSNAFKMFRLNDENEKVEAVLALTKAAELAIKDSENREVVKRIAFVQIEKSKNLLSVEAVIGYAERTPRFSELIKKIKEVFPIVEGQCSTIEPRQITDSSYPIRNDPKQDMAREEPNP